MRRCMFSWARQPLLAACLLWLASPLPAVAESKDAKQVHKEADVSLEGATLFGAETLYLGTTILRNDDYRFAATGQDLGVSAPWLFLIEEDAQLILRRYYLGLGMYVGGVAHATANTQPVNPMLAAKVAPARAFGLRLGVFASFVLPLKWLSLRLSARMGYRDFNLPITAYTYTVCSTYRSIRTCGPAHPDATLETFSFEPRLTLGLPRRGLFTLQAYVGGEVVAPRSISMGLGFAVGPP